MNEGYAEGAIDVASKAELEAEGEPMVTKNCNKTLWTTKDNFAPPLHQLVKYFIQQDEKDKLDEPDKTKHWPLAVPKDLKDLV